MAIQVACPACSTRLSVPETAAGQRIKCPTCAHVFPLGQAGSSPLGSPAPSSPGEMWHVNTTDNQRYGPVSREELDSWLAEGRLQAGYQLFRVGDSAWRPAAEVYPVLAIARPSSNPGSPFGSSPGTDSMSFLEDDNPYSSPTRTGAGLRAICPIRIAARRRIVVVRF